MKNGLDLGGAYGATLRRIKAQGGEKARLGMAVLMWVSHSRRPLQVHELCHAVAIRIGSNDHNSDDILTLSTLINCCQGLVTLEKSGSTIRLIHFTLQEYLCAHPDIFDKAHSTIAETCLTYLNFQHIKDFSAGPPSDPRSIPFLEYSSLYWGTHMRMEVSDCSKTLALQLLDRFDGHISAKSLWNSINGGLPSYLNPGSKPFSALHCTSYFGIAEVANTLLDMNRWDANQEDSAGTTPLIWAARHGHEEVVALLLRNEHIQPDWQDSKSDRTALSWAAENGHEGVVKLLLGRKDVNPEIPDTEYRQTPLSWAAENGREGTVKLLLGRKDVNPDSLSKSSRTPLSWAASRGHEGTVKLLLGRKDVNPEIPDTMYGQTPLSWAAENGHEGTVKLLLARKDVNPGIPDTRYGQTPLSWAAENGHEGTVKLLLGRKDVNPDSLCKSGQTPLLRAASRGHEGTVKLLLGRKDVNPDSLCKSCRTPLSWAAENGHEGTVKLLLYRKDVNPDNLSKSGQTPLTFATKNGHHTVVELLQTRLSRHVQ